MAKSKFNHPLRHNAAFVLVRLFFPPSRFVAVPSGTLARNHLASGIGFPGEVSRSAKPRALAGWLRLPRGTADRRVDATRAPVLFWPLHVRTVGQLCGGRRDVDRRRRRFVAGRRAGRVQRLNWNNIIKDAVLKFAKRQERSRKVFSRNMWTFYLIRCDVHLNNMDQNDSGDILAKIILLYYFFNISNFLIL